MIVTPIRTERVSAGETTLEAVIANSVSNMNEKSILAVTSKLVSLCENRVVPRRDASKEELIRKESEYYTADVGKYNFPFTITHNTLIPSAGIDESNGGGYYILWPEDSQKSANDIRIFLRNRFNIQNVGVIITDSTCTPLRWGTSGISIAHSGFNALRDYIGQPDLFGRPFEVSKANIAGGLAAAAVVTMGEGTEQTPLCLLEDIPFVTFQDENPSEAELNALRIPIEDDLYGPFLTGVKWLQ